MLGLASSCKNDDESNLGLGVQPPSDNINTIVSDTFTVVMSTVREDSLRTDVLSTNPLGEYDDPIYGTSTASLFLDFRKPDVSVDTFGTGNIDSIVLTMRYSTNSSQYGDPGSSMTFKVYQLNDRMDDDAYFSNSTIDYNSGVEIGSVTQVLNTTDSVKVGRGTLGTVNWGPHLRIKLSNADFIKAFEDADASVFNDDEGFKSFIRGLAIVPTDKSGTGVITSFDLISSISNLSVYYNNTSYVDFLINEDSRRVTTYKHTSLPSYITDQLSNPSINKDTTYLQAMGRVKTKITFPNLLNIVDKGNIAVVGAEIEFFVDQTKVSTDFPAPARLLIVQPDFEGRNAAINLLDLNREKGYYNSDRGSYKFSVSSHLQSIFNDWVTGNENNNRGLYIIIPTDNPTTPSRVVIDASKTKLKLFYNRVK